MYNVCYKALKNHKDALLKDIAVSTPWYNIISQSYFSSLELLQNSLLNIFTLTEKNFYLSLNLDSMLFAIHIKRFENLQLQRKL